MANAWEHWSAERIATASQCPVSAVRQHWPKIVDQLALCGIDSRLTRIAAIGTIAIETASTFAPVEEAFWMPDAWRRQNLRYYPFFGRGHIQLTWESNYRKYTGLIADLWGGGPDLVANPGRALDPDVSAAVLALYFKHHATAQGYTVPAAAAVGDWEWVRRLVLGGTDGLDRLKTIAATLLSDDRPATPSFQFDVDTPAFIQNDNWSCAPTSARWMLASLGRDPGEQIEEQLVIDNVVSKSSGLLHASGSVLARWFRETAGIPAGSNGAAEFDEIAARAGKQPLMIGGRRWGPNGHWSGVRGFDGERLRLANPAPGFGRIDQTMTSAEMAARGPFSAVWLDAGAGVEDDMYRELSEQLMTAVAYLGDDVADQLEQARARMTIPPLGAEMRAADWQQRAELLEALIHRMYSEAGGIGIELRRVRAQMVGPPPA